MSDSLYLLACVDVRAPLSDSSALLAPVGSPCLPFDESRQAFNGFGITEVALDVGSPACASGLCLVNHIDGRASCPYGQTEEEVDGGAARCFVPGTNLAVTVPVPSQRVSRRAVDNVICSCRCDGPGPGPFCACPSDMECANVVAPLGIEAGDVHAGSYCIKRGTEYDPVDQGTVSSATCADEPEACADP